MSLPPFQRLVDAHATSVHRYLVAALGRDEGADAFQETFLAALRAYPELRSAENLRGWLFTIARNKALDEHRARVRRPVPVAEADSGGSVALADGPDEELWAAVRELPPKQRAAVVLRFVNDFSHRDVARVLGCSEEAARRSLHEGLSKLREEWA